MATTRTSSSSSSSEAGPSGVLIQPSAWGYVQIPDNHPGVLRALEILKVSGGIRWDVLAEIAQLAGRAADDLVIGGGVEANGILIALRDVLVTQAARRR